MKIDLLEKYKHSVYTSKNSTHNFITDLCNYYFVFLSSTT
jgi:hypothetical protein